MKAQLSGLAAIATLSLVATSAGAQGVPVPHEGGVQHAGQTATYDGQHGSTPKDGELPLVPAQLRIATPSPSGPWIMHIDNVGEQPVRIAADARLLRLEVVGSKKSVTCEAPSALRPSAFPDERGLVLNPGETYSEAFDPRLFCFGNKMDALTGGALVRATLGWDSPKPWAKKKDAGGPFAAANVDFPATVKNAHYLRAPTVALSYAPQPKSSPDDVAMPQPMAPATIVDPKPDPHPPGHKGHAPGHGDGKGKDGPPGPTKKADVLDYNQPRLELDASRLSDAPRASDIAVTIHARNDGRREMLAALRPRMLSFEVEGPITHHPKKPPQTIRCRMPDRIYATPREMFRRYKPGESVKFRMLVAEMCPPDAFARPGLYEVRALMHATEDGSEWGLNAFTAKTRSIHGTLVRVHTGKRPYHRRPPVARPTSEVDPTAFPMPKKMKPGKPAEGKPPPPDGPMASHDAAKK